MWESKIFPLETQFSQEKQPVCVDRSWAVKIIIKLKTTEAYEVVI